MTKLGIFAGTFDPIHLGHTAFVEQSIEYYGLDEVFILVEKKPRFKTCLATYEDRKRMVEVAFADNPQITVYETSGDDFPITSSLPAIRVDYPTAQFYLLIGEDVAQHIDSWENADELLKDIALIIGKRDDQAPYGQTSSVKVRNLLKDQGTSEDLNSRVLSYIKEQNLYQN